MNNERLKTVLRQRRWPLLIGCLLIIGGIALSVIAFTRVTTTVGVTPSIATITPKGESIKALGGWSLVSPKGNDPVYAYTDTILGTAITVSQQTLPHAFVADSDTKVAELAKAYNATNKIVAGDTTIYIGTNADGPQSVIFTKNNLLIMIKSKATIKNSDWASYIQSLS